MVWYENMPAKRLIFVDDLEVWVIEKQRNRRANLRVQPDGRIECSVPHAFPDELVADFVREKRDWIEAAQRSPVWRLIHDYEVALPLHPEYRTMPMVWYIPPLSPVVDVVTGSGNDGEDANNLFAAIDKLRIPIGYLAELFTAGDTAPVDLALRKLAAMRSYMRGISLDDVRDESIALAVGMDGPAMEEMYRLLAIAKYEERYVIPPAHAEQAHDLALALYRLFVSGENSGLIEEIE